MLLLPAFIEKFANTTGMWVVFIIGVAFTLYMIVKKKDTSPPGNLPNTGKPWVPGPSTPIPDNRPKPPAPPSKDDV